MIEVIFVWLGLPYTLYLIRKIISIKIASVTVTWKNEDRMGVFQIYKFKRKLNCYIPNHGSSEYACITTPLPPTPAPLLPSPVTFNYLEPQWVLRQ